MHSALPLCQENSETERAQSLYETTIDGKRPRFIGDSLVVHAIAHLGCERTFLWTTSRPPSAPTSSASVASVFQQA